MPSEPDARLKAIETAAHGSAFGRDQDQRLACQPGRWSKTDGGVDILVQSCTLKDGGWPYLTIAAVNGGHLIVAEGTAAVVPLISQVIDGRPAATASTASGSAEDKAAKIARLEALLGSTPNLYATGDLDTYKSLVELARLYEGLQNYAGAERAYLQALQIQSRILPADNPAIGETLLEVALAVSNQGRAEEADALFNRADLLIQRGVDPLITARFASYRAVAAANEHKFPQALALAIDATAQRRTILGYAGADDDAIGGETSASVFGNARTVKGELAQSLYLEAAMAYRTTDGRVDNLGLARASIAEAMDILNSVQGLPIWWRPRFLMVQAEISQKSGKVEDAEAQLTVALGLQQKLFGETAPTASVYMALGRMYQAEGLSVRAVESFEKGVAILSTTTAARDELSTDKLTPYLDALDAVAVMQPDRATALREEMFEAAQLADGGVASQTIARAAARIEANDPTVAALSRSADDAAHERDNLQLRLANETGKPTDRRDAKLEGELAAQLQTATKHSDELAKQLAEAYPAFNRLTTPHSAKSDEVRDQLGSNEALVSFLFGPEKSYGFLITKSGLTVAKLSISSEDLTDTVSELRRAFQVTSKGPAPFDLKLSHKLYAELLGPFATPLKGVSDLAVVSSKALLSLPPALLVVSAPAPGHDADYASADWLMRKVATSLVPSPQDFLSLRALKARASAPDPFIGFGAPLFVGAAAGSNSLTALGTECRTGGAVSSDMIRSLAPLPETADEVRQIATMLKAPSSDVILGQNVSKATLRDAKLDRFRVVYFATHGLLPGELRCQSEPGLAMSPPAKQPSSPSDDGLLVSSEVAALHLDADLVVLSACNTAGDGLKRGGKFGGPALSGLAESFFYAGGRAVLASHWQVPSVTTVALMTGMFQRLGPQLNGGVSDALRASQQVIAANPKTAHPFYWAAFTLIGDGSGLHGERAASN